MLYDTTLSDEIPVYKILDYMIQEDYDPNTIVEYIGKYSDEEIREIGSNSINLNRILCDFFVSKLRMKNIDTIYRIILNIDNKEVGLYLSWQILQSRIKIPEMVKEKFRKFVAEKGISFVHPYSRSACGGSKELKFLDDAISKWVSDETIAYYLNHMDLDLLVKLAMYRRSLYKYRILQSSVFELLSVDRQYAFIKSFGSDDAVYTDKESSGYFMKQILYSSSHEDAKLMALSCLRDFDIDARDCFGKDDEDLGELYRRQESSSILRINLDMLGVADNENILMHHLIHYPDIIKEMYEEDNEFLQKFLPIGDLPLVLDRYTPPKRNN